MGVGVGVGGRMLRTSISPLPPRRGSFTAELGVGGQGAPRLWDTRGGRPGTALLDTLAGAPPPPHPLGTPGGPREPGVGPRSRTAFSLLCNVFGNHGLVELDVVIMSRGGLSTPLVMNN